LPPNDYDEAELRKSTRVREFVADYLRTPVGISNIWVYALPIQSTFGDPHFSKIMPYFCRTFWWLGV
jgi:hypothetical protein